MGLPRWRLKAKTLSKSVCMIWLSNATAKLWMPLPIAMKQKIAEPLGCGCSDGERNVHSSCMIGVFAEETPQKFLRQILMMPEHCYSGHQQMKPSRNLQRRWKTQENFLQWILKIL